MVNTIIIKNDDTSGNTPADNELVTGELAVNTTDGKLFYGDNNGDAQEFAMGGSNQTLTTGNGISGANSGSSGNFTMAVEAAQTTITSILATDLKIGEDDQTKIDFETANKINFYADNEKQLVLEDGAFYPGSDNIIDLGKSDVEFKDAFFDGTVTTDSVSIGGHTINAIDASSEASNANDHLMTALAIKNRIEDFGYTTNTGDVTLSGAQTFTGAKTFQTDTKPLFRDSGLFINSSADGTLKISSDDELSLEADDNVQVRVKDTFTIRENTDDDIFMRVHPDNQTLELRHNDSATNQFAILVEANGATTLSTADSDGTAGHMTLDVDGNLTLDADGGTITFSDAGSSLGTITSSGYSGTAAVATTVTITDNESTNENNALIFTAGGDTDGGNLGLESDGTCTYNPSTGKITATGFVGALTGNASTATKLAATKTIAGVAFDGSANISLNNNAITNGAGYTTNTGTVDTTGTVNANEFAQFNDSNTLQALTAAEMRSALNVADGATANTGDITGVTAGDGLTGGGTSGAVSLAVGVDDSSIEINSDALRVKASGITNSMLAGSIATSKISSGTFADARIASSNVTQHSGDITSLGTLSALTVDNINVNGNTIKSTNSNGDLIFGGNDGGSAITALTLDMSASGKAIFNDSIQVGDEARMASDSSAIRFGSDEEIVLEHVHDTGLKLYRSDDGGTPTLQFFDSSESIGSDGSKLILKSGGTTFNMPTSDGSSGHFLKTNGSGTLSFAAASGGSTSPSGSGSVANNNAEIQFNDDGSFGSDGAFFWDGTKLVIEVATDDTAALKLKCTEDTDQDGPRLDLERSAGGSNQVSDGDEIGRIRFNADKTNGSLITYAALEGGVVDNSDSTADGIMRVGIRRQGGYEADFLNIGCSSTGGNRSVFAGTTNEVDLGTDTKSFKACYARTFIGHNGSTNQTGTTDGFNFVTGNSIDVTLSSAGGIVFEMRALNLSDENLKDNITQYNTGLAMINQLTPKSFTIKDKVGTSIKDRTGFIAQDLEKISSDYVEESNYTEGDTKFLALSQKFNDELIAAQINAIKELSAKNDALEARIAALEAK